MKLLPLGALLTAGLLLVTAVAGCSFAALSPSQTDPPPATAPACQSGVAEALLDSTGSTNGMVVGPGKALVKANLADLIAGPECGTVFYLARVSQNSFDPQDVLLHGWIPRIDPLPTFEPQQQWESKAHYLQRLAAYWREQRIVRKQLAAASRAVSRIDRQIDALQVPSEDIGTDLTGAFLAYQQRATTTGTRTLLAVTDLQPAGPQSQGRLALAGVRVTIVHLCGITSYEPAAECQAVRSHWQELLHHARAIVKFYDFTSIDFVHHAL